MANGKFVSYLRVSTAKQGASGLGLDAQRAAVAGFLNGGSWELLREFVEIESGKAEDNRPKLAEAMALCRLYGATLVVAKLDRLSRNAAFLMALQAGSVKFVAADMPEANEMVVGIMAVIAQAERKMISGRTKAALAAAKAKGRKLGGDRGNLNTAIRARGTVNGIKARQDKAKVRATDIKPVIDHLRSEGAVSLRDIAAGLNDRAIPTARGGSWSAVQVQRVLVQMQRGAASPS